MGFIYAQCCYNGSHPLDPQFQLWSGELPGSAVGHSFLFHEVNILFNTVSRYEFNKCSNLDLHIMHDTSNT